MLKMDKYGLITCHLCGKLFEHNDEVCTISARTFDTYNMNFAETKINSDDIEIPREINFHQHCFTWVAGRDYTP